MEDLSQEAQYQLMKGWLNERQWRLYVATEAKRIGVGGISQVAREAGVTRKRSAKEYENWRLERAISQESGYASQGVDARKSPKRTWATSRFGKDAGAEGRSAEPGQMDEQVGEQAEGSPQQPRTHDWRDRHPQDVKSDGIFAQSQQEEDGRDVACRSGRPVSAHQ